MPIRRIRKTPLHEIFPPAPVLPRRHAVRLGPRHAWIEITLTEGRHRQVRRMAEAVGHPVLKLHRVALGPLTLGSLLPGRFRFLSEKEIKNLRLIGRASKRRPARRSSRA